MRIIKLIQHTFFSLIFGLTLFSCNEAAISPYPNIQFTRKSVIPGVGRSSAVSFVINGKGYVALGRNADRSGQLNDCWEYNPATDSWSEKSIFPGKARVKAMAATVNDKAYVGLGFDLNYPVYSNIDSSYLKDFWMYDPVSDNWTRKADFPSLATDGCVSYADDKYVYVAGGFNGHGFTNEYWKYDTDSDKWTRLANFKSNPARFGGVLCKSTDKIYYGTGYCTWNQNDWWEYTPTNGNWKQLKSMPDDGRENGVGLTIDNRFIVLTGKHFAGNLTGGRTLSDIMEYDVTKDVWYDRGNIPAQSRANAIAFTIDGIGYIGFGDNDSTVINDFWSFKP
jgi:N-acetylneuraminic acid mutarotase